MKKKTVEISVTAEHINHGVAGECARCPIALALHEIVPQANLIEVGADHVRFYMGDPANPHVSDLPCAAEFFVQDFDGGEDVEPFTFTLQIPEEVAA